MCRQSEAKAELASTPEEILSGPGFRETVLGHRFRISEGIIESAISTFGS